MPIEDLRELYASTFNGPILSTTKQEEMSTSSEHSTEQEEGHDYQSLTIRIVQKLITEITIT